jgi:hypothetical protein
MRTREEELFRAKFDQAVRGHRTATFGGATSVQRRSPQMIDVQALRIDRGLELRVLEAGGGAGAGDVGKFWEVPGYSRTGGGDIPRA